MKYYAELNAENSCTGISQVKDSANAENRAELKNYDLSVIGKRYNEGTWEEVPIEPVEEETETEAESETEPVTETVVEEGSE